MEFDSPKGKFHAYKSALIVTALDEMVKQGLLLVLDATHGTYMLTQPIGTFTQTVQISPYTAHLVTDAFNFFSCATNSDYVANKLAVTDSEIQGLALITFSLRDQIDGMHAQIKELENMMELDSEEGDGEWPPLGANTPENN